MRSKSKELDVDFIGEQGSGLTKKEEEGISNFISLQKERRLKFAINKSRQKEKLT